MELLNSSPSVPFFQEQIKVLSSSDILQLLKKKKAQLRELSSPIIKMANVLFKTIDLEKLSIDHFIMLKRGHLNQQGPFQ